MSLNAAELCQRVLYRDEDLLVLDKPPGLAVHGGPKGGVTLDHFLEDLRFGAIEKPQLAHRLDRETTGCLVLGRTNKALRRLGTLFRDGRITKVYYALVCGLPASNHGEIIFPLARRSHDKRSWWMKVDPAGDNALTEFRVLGRADGLALLELLPRTGRTHQLRVHCAASGWPIAGDRIYGGDRAKAAAPGLMLHAGRITIPLNPARPPITVTAALPQPTLQFLTALGLQNPIESEKANA
jgi:tRNA pseudouridine32 synthase/23S rRNA pseudouridine746 synthase